MVDVCVQQENLMKSKNEMVEDLLGLVESGKLVAPGTAASGASAAGAATGASTASAATPAGAAGGASAASAATPGSALV